MSGVPLFSFYFHNNTDTIFRGTVASTGGLYAQSIVSRVPVYSDVAHRPLNVKYRPSVSEVLRLRHEPSYATYLGGPATYWIQRGTGDNLSDPVWSDIIALPTAIQSPALRLTDNLDVCSLDGFAYVLCSSGIIRRLELDIDRISPSRGMDPEYAALKFGDQWSDEDSTARSVMPLDPVFGSGDFVLDPVRWENFARRNFFIRPPGMPPLAAYAFDHISVYDYAPHESIVFLMSDADAIYQVSFDLHYGRTADATGANNAYFEVYEPSLNSIVRLFKLGQREVLRL